ncbi:nicotinate-nucleotide--dimethylbenzimidazole phosphoribosyltransferase [Paenibacillus sp. J31TS4]|uniref:nicotinate-nucleotide--dimethylbenzimidazole phosphoribosyltransferase n=1 Tax=Paenibacillus sp. J31TS4 TaxID=2807195 RepID=UPI001B1151C8|nr:nicotinate-nucleotide--dimethylbenzimidazole phosphoribosyltransferase [Paenibacillus sp. J31TS4]GIP38783.1 nicotinate-nucleotide--dimethylbenzimidazole phosphoribosyltransferase [Paenibacillus sp. J31TS4]
MKTLQQMLDRILPLSEKEMEAAGRRLDSLTKPPGSLGRLEEIGRQLAGIAGMDVLLGEEPPFERKAVIVMAGDHGVCEEGVSAFPAEVTPQMVRNILNGGAAVNVLARQAGAEVVCVDIGVDAELDDPRLVSRKIRRGTGNIARGPAMTREEAERAVLAGCEVVADLAERGVRLFATGEMGIGNTTPSAALLTVLGGIGLGQSVGRGTGIDDARWLHKQEIIRRAIETNRPDADDPLDVLAKLGGLEIAGLVGVILGAAAHRCPVVIDGFISSAAALVAVKLCPGAAAYLLASHLSGEQGHRLLLETLHLSPLLHAQMRLGEGTGAVLCFPIMEAAVAVMREMATFESAGVSGQ